MFIVWLISIITGYSLFFSSEESSVGLVMQSLLVSCVVLAVCIMIAMVKDRIAHRERLS